MLPDGGIPPAQDSAYSAAINECVATNHLPTTPDDALLAPIVYRHWVKMKSCLQDLGYEVSEPPSEETFVAQYVTPLADYWNPFEDLSTLTPEEFEEATAVCPQVPPELSGAEATNR